MGDFRQTLSLATILAPRTNCTGNSGYSGNSGNSQTRTNFYFVFEIPRIYRDIYITVWGYCISIRRPKFALIRDIRMVNNGRISARRSVREIPSFHVLIKRGIREIRRPDLIFRRFSNFPEFAAPHIQE